MPFALRVLDQRLAISRLPADAAIPPWMSDATGFRSVTRTPSELSIVCDERDADRAVRAIHAALFEAAVPA